VVSVESYVDLESGKGLGTKAIFSGRERDFLNVRLGNDPANV
jgi:hypothetical protein